MRRRPDRDESPERHGSDGCPAGLPSAGGSATIKALVKARAERGLWLEQVPVPEVGDHDILIRTLRTGICRTDWPLIESTGWPSSDGPYQVNLVRRSPELEHSSHPHRRRQAARKYHWMYPSGPGYKCRLRAGCRLGYDLPSRRAVIGVFPRPLCIHASKPPRAKR